MGPMPGQGQPEGLQPMEEPMSEQRRKKQGAAETPPKLLLTLLTVWGFSVTCQKSRELILGPEEGEGLD